MSSFKLIALRPLKGCEDYILKCLKTDTFYYFCNDYTIAEDGKSYRQRSRNISPLEDGFFIVDEKAEDRANDVNLNFSAIVGKNGDGKSTIVELIARIINNFAKSKELCSKDDNLKNAYGTCAELYYMIDDAVYCISCKSKEKNAPEISVWKLFNSDSEPNGNSESITDEDYKDYTFYTFISNYSLYSYNIAEMQQEWEDRNDAKSCWMDKVFHKNDGYKMPLSLHPLRDKGIIDVNRERGLSDQRIISLMINADANRQSNFRQVNGKTATYLYLKLSDTSKFLQSALLYHIRQLFNKDLLNVKADYGYTVLENYTNSIETPPDSKTGFTQIDYLRKYFDDIKSKIRQVQNLYQANKDIIDKANDYLKNAQEHQFDFISHEQDIGQMMDIYRQLSGIIGINGTSGYTNYIKLPDDTEDKSQEEWIDIPGFLEGYSMAQIQWIVLIGDICKIWNNEYNGGTFIHTEDSFKMKTERLFSEPKDLTLKWKAYQYIIYKTIDVLDNYEIYGKPLNRYTDSILNVKHDDIFDNLVYSARLFVKDIYVLKTHISLKIRQTLNYLHNSLLGNEDIYQKRSVLKDATNELYGENCYGDTLDSLKSMYKGNTSLDILPPPIYDSHLIFVPNDNESQRIPMERLSSGERQRLQSLSAILYHLQNLNSVGNDNERTSYRYINIILEEIELYFHPEYQRRCVNELRKAILSMPLGNINAINVIMVTHSPFILSDIPMTNVLFLKDGMPVREMQQNTFGANIHSLLKNGFFMPTLPIGEFAHDKINEMFRKLNTGDFKEEDLSSIYNDIQRVGEPYIKSQLKEICNSYRSGATTPEFVREMRDELKALKSQVQELQRQNSHNDRH